MSTDLINYLQKIQLPNVNLPVQREISTVFFTHHITTLWHAIAWVHQLPYGRNTERHKYELVLSEQKGTCSTKHALVKPRFGS